MNAALETQAISVAFGGVRAVQAVNVAVRHGERRVVIGPNGSGKSTFFNLIGGQLRPTAGRIILYGRDITGDPPWRRARLGLARTFQMSRVFQGLTVKENLIIATAGIAGFGVRSFAAFGSNRQAARRADALLDYWGLAAHKSTRVHALSYGVQRLLDIALAFAVDPRVVILDEPTAGLSAGERELMTARLNGLPRGVTLLLTDHDMDVVFRVCDEITVLDRGQAIAQGSPEAIRRDTAVRDIYLGSF